MTTRQTILSAFTGLSLIALAGCKDAGVEPQQQSAPPPVSGSVSFQTNVKPILTAFGCTGCHGGTNNLFLNTVDQIKRGGINGPAVTAGDSTNSLIVRKISPIPPFGDRMPQGGPYLPDSTVRVIKIWIAQGAQDN